VGRANVIIAITTHVALGHKSQVKFVFSLRTQSSCACVFFSFNYEEKNSRRLARMALTVAARARVVMSLRAHVVSFPRQERVRCTWEVSLAAEPDTNPHKRCWFDVVPYILIIVMMRDGEQITTAAQHARGGRRTFRILV
jgi:hypothetical protein